MKNKYSKIVLATLLIVSIAGGIFYWQNRNTSYTEDGITYAPATEQEKQESEQHKDQIVQDSNAEKKSQKDQNSTASKKQVAPTISAWGQASAGGDFRINGFVSGIIESNGSCTIRMTKDGTSINETKKALPNAQSTTCGQIVVPGARLSPGSWNVVLSYESETSQGASESIAIEVK